MTVQREPETVPLPGPGQPARLDGGAATTIGTGASIAAQTNGTNGSDGSGGAAAAAAPATARGPRGGRRRAAATARRRP